MDFDYSKFEEEYEVFEIVRTYQHICRDLDKKLEMKQSDKLDEQYCCHWPFNRRNAEYYQNIFDPQKELYVTFKIKIPKGTEWMENTCYVVNFDYLNELDLYVMNPSFH